MRGAAAALRWRPVRVTLRRVAASVLPPRVRRRLLLLAALGGVLAAGYMLWLRDASFVRVEKVTVTGLTTDDAPKVRMALASAGRSMTTLHVDHERLDRAVAGYAAVRALEVDSDFPNGLRIRVVEHAPVAVATSRGSRVAVSGDGGLLRGVSTRGLPLVEVRGALPAERIAERPLLAELRLLGAAPAPLRRRLLGVKREPGRGFVVRMRRGPDLVFGRLVRLGAKWLAAARVLADPAARGATYIDLRLPERPAAGGLPEEPEDPAAGAGAPPPAPAQPAAPATGAAPVTPPAAPAPTSPQQAPAGPPVNPQP